MNLLFLGFIGRLDGLQFVDLLLKIGYLLSQFNPMRSTILEQWPLVGLGSSIGRLRGFGGVIRRPERFGKWLLH